MNAENPDADNLRHLFKELSHDILSAVASTPPARVREFTFERKGSKEDLQNRRIFQGSSGRLSELMSFSRDDATLSFREVLCNDFKVFCPAWRVCFPIIAWHTSRKQNGAPYFGLLERL